MDGEQPPKTRPERLAGWVVKEPIAALTIVAAALYAIVRLGQQLFYEEFGLAPEDVGLGYGETLARAAGFAIYVAIGVGLPLAGLTWLGLHRIRKAAQLKERKNVIRLLVSAYVATIVSLVAVVSVAAILNARSVKRGDSVSSFFVLDLGIRGEPTEISWLDAAPEALAELEDHELMLLDQSGGTVTLYDVTEQQTVQVPSSAVAVSLTR